MPETRQKNRETTKKLKNGGARDVAGSNQIAHEAENPPFLIHLNLLLIEFHKMFIILCNYAIFFKKEYNNFH